MKRKNCVISIGRDKCEIKIYTLRNRGGYESFQCCWYELGRRQTKTFSEVKAAKLFAQPPATVRPLPFGEGSRAGRSQGLLHDIVFALALGETNDGKILVLGEIEHLSFESGRHLSSLFCGGKTMPFIFAEVGGHPGVTGELKDIGVEIHAVDALKFKRDIFTLESGNTAR